MKNTFFHLATAPKLLLKRERMARMRIILLYSRETWSMTVKNIEISIIRNSCPRYSVYILCAHWVKPHRIHLRTRIPYGYALRHSSIFFPH